MALRSTTPILGLTLLSFFCFSLYIYITHKRTNDLISFFRSFIEAIQYVTLDDVTVILRRNAWYFSIIGICFVVLLNHLLMNVIVSQVFNSVGKT